MGIKKVKGGYKVKSYVTGKMHRDSQGGYKVYKTKLDAEQAAGLGRGKRTVHKRY